MQRPDRRIHMIPAVFKTRPLVSTIMVIAALLGLAFMIVGLPPVSGICFVVALVCALTIIINAMSEKRHE